MQRIDPPLVRAVLLDLPGLLFFSTYTLLVLFWAEIYHQARSLPTSTLRPIFIAANIVVYALQVCASPAPDAGLLETNTRHDLPGSSYRGMNRDCLNPTAAAAWCTLDQR